MPYLRRLFSDDFRMPLAMAAGVALLVGYSLQVLVDDAGARFAQEFHTAGHTLVWISLLLGAVHGVKAAYESLRALKPNIDVLMVVGAGLAAAIGHPGEGALLLFMFTLAGALEHRALARARDSVTRLSRLMPTEALKREGGAWAPVAPETLAPGDVVLVRPGETVPADGVVAKGRSTVDQSTLTGESLPRNVDEGDEVFAGAMNQNGALEVRVARPVRESSLQRILDLVTEAQAQRQPIQRVIDTVSTPYTLCVFVVALGALVFFTTLYTGADGGPMTLADAAYRAITLLIVASPCALVIATPTATLCGLNRAARAGLLVKGGDALERLSRARTFALDKTGTLTTGRLRVIRVEPPELAHDLRLLGAALAIEERSTHPIAVAIAQHAREAGAQPAPIGDFAMIPGRGIEADIEGQRASVGTIEYVAPRVSGDVRAQLEEAVARVRAEGAISAAFAIDGQGLVFALADTARPGAERLVPELKRAGVRRVVMLTGDSEVIARRVGEQLGVDEVHAGLLPEHKVARLRALKAERSGPLAVVGDGVNDAPALAVADVGLAMGGVGADAAMETADIVILSDDLRVIPWGLRLARRARLVMFANLVFALGVIVVLAVGALIGWVPMGVGVIGHEGSTLIVVGNSLQLLAFRGVSDA